MREPNLLLSFRRNYWQTVRALKPSLWYNFDESASPAVNYGSLGSDFNATVTNMGAFRQTTGLSRIPYSYDFNGATSVVVVPTSALLQSSDWTVACLVNPDTAGEGGNGTFVELMDGASNFALFFTAGSLATVRLRVRNAANTVFDYTANAGTTAGAWRWMIAEYSDTTRQGRIWRTIPFDSSTDRLNEYTLSSPPTVTGIIRQPSVIKVGNVNAGTNTFDGKYAQFLYWKRLLTNAQRQALVAASGI